MSPKANNLLTSHFHRREKVIEPIVWLISDYYNMQKKYIHWRKEKKKKKKEGNH